MGDSPTLQPQPQLDGGVDGDASPPPAEAGGDADPCATAPTGKQLTADGFQLNGTFYGVAAGPDGVPIIVGSYNSVGPIGTATSPAPVAGIDDAIVFKRAGGGAVAWHAEFGGSGSDTLYGVVTDSAGNAYAVGQTSSPKLTIGATVLTTPGGTNQPFLVKLDGGKGTVSWVRALTQPVSGARCYPIAITNDHLAVSCAIPGSAGSLTYPTPTGTASIGLFTGYDAIIYAIDLQTGGATSVTRLGPADNAAPSSYSTVDSVDVLPTGEILASGMFNGPVLKDKDVSGGAATVNLTRVGSGSNGWQALFDTKGSASTTRQFGGANSNIFSVGSSRDGAGGVRVAITYLQTLDLGLGPVTASGTSDVLLAGYKSGAQAPTWQKNVGTPGQDMAEGIRTDPCGDIVTTLLLDVGTVVLDGVSLPSAQPSAQASVIVKLDSNGKALWANGLTPPQGSGADLKAFGFDSKSRNTLAVGGFNGAVDLGLGAVSSNGGAVSPLSVSYQP